MEDRRQIGNIEELIFHFQLLQIRLKPIKFSYIQGFAQLLLLDVKSRILILKRSYCFLLF